MARTNNTGIRVDVIGSRIILDVKFAKAASHFDSEAYKRLQKAKEDNPEFSVELKVIKRNPSKESYKGLTYAYMEEYISSHDKDGKIMAEYNELRLRAKCHSIRYAHIKSWFLNVFPEIDDFDCKIDTAVSEKAHPFDGLIDVDGAA